MKTIPLTKGETAIVDDEDYEKLTKHSWCMSSNGYAKRCVFGKKRGINKTILMHQEVIDAKKGEWIDHINHNKLDNRKENLRICNASTNGANQRVSVKNTSGYKGVSWDKEKSKWLARIAYKGKQMNLGRYFTAREAAMAYNAKALELYKEFAYLNKV